MKTQIESELLFVQSCFFHFQAVSVAVCGTDQSPEKSKERFPLISVGFVWSLSQLQCHPIETN